ncbi:MAG: D-amino acid aminotransferase [Alphaproteobacteria bacterium]|nr:D-amino acid aminotransferase [Alphaproteobacteria bacterium]
MASYTYVNGRYLPHIHATTHIDDRGYLFADGVYEVIKLVKGVLIDGEPHFKRLLRSQTELDFGNPIATSMLNVIIDELCRRNRCYTGYIYIQITRGTAPRQHHYKRDMLPNVVVELMKMPKTPEKYYTEGVKAISFPDRRWSRRDIKSISLLPNILAKQAAKDEGVMEAILVDEKGMVSEGSSTNIYMVEGDGTIVTHPANEQILGGITRETVLLLARHKGMKVREVPFSLEAAKAASEVFLTSTVLEVCPIVEIDDTVIKGGSVGPVTKALNELYRKYILSALEDETHDGTEHAA